MHRFDVAEVVVFKDFIVVGDVAVCEDLGTGLMAALSCPYMLK